MKTFTLRLSETESEALERLAFVNKTSKNDLLRMLISREYHDLDANATYFENELIDISAVQFFTEGIIEAIEERNKPSKELEDLFKNLNALSALLPEGTLEALEDRYFPNTYAVPNNDIMYMLRSTEYALEKSESEGLTDEEISKIEIMREQIVDTYLR